MLSISTNKFKANWKTRAKKSKDFSCTDCRPTRRKFLNQVSHLTLSSLALLSCSTILSSCSLLEDKEVKIGTLKSLKEKSILLGELNDKTIFVSQKEDGKLYALDLTCTHKQCTVKFEDELDGFKCPCHKGRYNKFGKVISGKPPKDLFPMKIEVRGEEIWVLKS